jgi:glyoxylase-like metal-dependent hydrolase (beta-lactamase superfamily II)
MSDLYLKQLSVGPMANFAYLVGSRSAKQCLAVDPAWDVPAIRAAAEADGMEVVGALVSHYHPDHCGGHLWGHDIQGVAELVADKPLPIYVQQDEMAGIMQVTGLSRGDFKPCVSGDKVTVGGVDITLIHTPGHTPGSQCFLCQGNLISGDTLFITGCGRVDLPGGNADQLYDSLTNKIAKLPDETVVYPGHHYDPATHATLAKMKTTNPYLQANSVAAWRQLRG